MPMPAPTLGVKLLKWKEQVNFFIWYVMRNFFQNRIEVKSLFGIHIPPFLRWNITISRIELHKFDSC